jgi:hypothetical protein
LAWFETHPGKHLRIRAPFPREFPNPMPQQLDREPFVAVIARRDGAGRIIGMTRQLCFKLPPRPWTDKSTAAST